MNAILPFYRTAENEFIDMHNPDDIDFLSKNFPAMMSGRPAANLSDEYQFLPSYKIAEAFQDRFNLQLVRVAQQRSTKRDPRFQEHVMRFRFNNDAYKLTNVGDTMPEIVVSNTHNGRSKLRLYRGLFRLVCSNGMVVPSHDFGSKAFRHFGELNSFDSLSKNFDEVARSFQVLDARIQKLQGYLLSEVDQIFLARRLMEARKAPFWMEPEMVLKARRPEEEPAAGGFRSLWTTFNVLQENLANANLEFEIELNGAPRTRRIRQIGSAMADIAINEALWQTMEAFIQERFPEVQGEILETEVAGEISKEIPEEQNEEDHGVETKAVSFDEAMALSYEEMLDVDTSSWTKEQKTKFSKRKSAQKAKANA